MSGYNLYISEYMKRNISTGLDRNFKQWTSNWVYSLGIQRPITSVSAPHVNQFHKNIHYLSIQTYPG